MKTQTSRHEIAPDGLVRALGLAESTAVVVGTLIGSGIFLVSKEMVLAVHSVFWIFLAWVVGAMLSLFGALSYAELGTLRPQAGGEYVYLRDGLGPLPGYLFGWGMFWIIRPASVATIGAGFARAAGFIWPQLDTSLKGLPIAGAQLLAAAVIGLVTLINYFGVRYGGQVQKVFTVGKLALVLVLTVAAFTAGHGDWSHLQQHLGEGVTLGGFGAALVAALWAYDGWNDLTLAGSEIRDPERTIPRSMIFGVLLVFAFYCAINLAYFYVLSPAQVAVADNVASAMAATFWGRHAGAFVAAAVMVSVFATLNSSILSGARVPFALARDGLFFRSLAAVHPRFRTPHISLLVQALFAVGFALTGSYARLYTLTIFSEWLFYALAVTALFAFRRRGERGPYKSWGYPVVPAIFLVIAVVLLVLTFTQNLLMSSVGLVIILAGVPAFYWWSQKRRKEAVARA